MWKSRAKSLEELAPQIERLREKKAQLDAMRPLPASALQNLKDTISIEWTYNSNAIEGNTLTLNETRVVVEHGITIGGKTIREHIEATNHAKAIDTLMGMVSWPSAIKEHELLKLHYVVLKDIDTEFAGRFRNGGLRITGANFNPPNALKVPEMLTDLLSYVEENPLGLDPVLVACVFHHRFVWVHPFFDGNGRTVRLAMNLMLMREGYPPAIILKNDRKKYYDALNTANNGSYSKLGLLVCQALERSLNIYLAATPGNYEEYVPISQIVSEPGVPYGQEYLSLLARRGQIDAYKDSRDWLTTRAAVTSYIEQRKRNRK